MAAQLGGYEACASRNTSPRKASFGRGEPSAYKALHRGTVVQGFAVEQEETLPDILC
jgi:hypothetical protein